ncbi:MAG TPA: S53 family peptidase [Mycobacteriales bacterium]|nr:S53 family peptidase [Mycobacteriales bacterium]
MKRSTAHRTLAVAAVAAIAATAAPAIAAAGDPHPVQNLVSRIDAIPSWAHGLPAALEPAAAPVQISLALKGRNQTELKRLVAAVSDPASPSYRHFLSNAQFNRRFAPSRAALSAARTWLQASGLVVDGVTPGRGLVTAHAPAATVGRLFHTTFGLFHVASRLLRAPLTEPTLPAALRPVVSTVIGLAQNPAVSDASPAPGYLNARPCSRFYGQRVATKLPRFHGTHQPFAVCGYTARQIRSTYGVNRIKTTGRGATVAVVDAFASPTIGVDVDTWSKRMGLPKLESGQLAQQVLPGIASLPEISPLVDPQGWAGEESLDVEAVHGMAPGAKIVYYAALAGFGVNAGPYEVGLEPLIVALGQAVGDGKADVVSNSWGGANDNPTPGDTVILDAITNQAAAKGITIDFSSGDSGDEVSDAGKRLANFPATSTGVVAVGGTTLEVGENGKRISESYWGTQKVPFDHGTWDYAKKEFSGGAGGGVSTTYAQPVWQRRVVPRGEATYGGVKPGRVEPDLSLVADSTTGILIGQTQHFADGKDRYDEYRIGGTSVSCPLFSGILALAVATAHHRLGLVTPTLYAKAGTAAGRNRLFYDPVAVPRANGMTTLANVRPDYVASDDPSSNVTYSLRVLSNLSTLHARRGFDDSTGLGVPRAAALVAALSSGSV